MELVLQLLEFQVTLNLKLVKNLNKLKDLIIFVLSKMKIFKLTWLIGSIIPSFLVLKMSRLKLDHKILTIYEYLALLINRKFIKRKDQHLQLQKWILSSLRNYYKIKQKKIKFKAQVV